VVKVTIDVPEEFLGDVYMAVGRVLRRAVEVPDEDDPNQEQYARSVPSADDGGRAEVEAEPTAPDQVS
jgi:hypothetical protein